jgi:hypothetical protein
MTYRISYDDGLAATTDAGGHEGATRTEYLGTEYEALQAGAAAAAGLPLREVAGEARASRQGQGDAALMRRRHHRETRPRRLCAFGAFPSLRASNLTSHNAPYVWTLPATQISFPPPIRQVGVDGAAGTDTTRVRHRRCGHQTD